MKNTLLPSLTFLALLFAQTPVLSQEVKWNAAPEKGFVYEITNKEAQRLLTSTHSKGITNSLLHTLVDTFDVRKGWLKRPAKGHFILVSIAGNKLHCEYTCVFPYQVFLLREYNAMALQVVDPDGNVREDAKVKVGFRRLYVDEESKTYRMGNNDFPGENPNVTVELFGFRSIYDMFKHEVPTTYNWDDDERGPQFYSYLITDKNKYKPGEKVRFKSYALSFLKSPLRKELEIWLTSYPEYKKIGTINPYRPGGYSGEFLLHDSLKLVLDKNYQLELREKNGRTVAFCSFRYEDYELMGNKLRLDLEKDKHYFPETNHITITATDANGLILKDAKATVLIRTNTILQAFEPLVVLPDTLFLARLDLDPSKPAVMDIPCDIFKRTNTSYDVVVSVINSQNQRMECIQPATYYFSSYELSAGLSNDSICFNLLKNNIPVDSIPIKLNFNNDRDTSMVILPYKEKLNPAILVYRFKNDLIARDIPLINLSPTVRLNGGIQSDSFKISMVNPQQLDVPWFIYQGSHLLSKGSGKELDYRSLIEDRTQTFYAELLFSFGGQDQAVRRQFEFKEEYLNVSVDLPDRVYPGQKVDATITVNDQLGKPVRNVDLTAMAATSKLNYYIPDLPYFGTSSSPRTKGATYSKEDLNRYKTDLDLDYKKWAPLARLDTMQYFQFLYPASKGFIRAVNCHDKTQFTVFVIKKGIAKQIHVIELDRRPVYYSWTNQPKGYSFYVSPKGKHQVTLRMWDKVLILDSMSFEKDKKTIISLDLDHLPSGTRVLNLENKFSQAEINRHRDNISEFLAGKNSYAYLQSESEFVPLFSRYNYFKDSPSYGKIIAGPIIPEKKTYVETETLKTTYRQKGGYQYSFEDNIVYKTDAADLIPKFLFDTDINPAKYISDGVVNKKYFIEIQNKDPRPDVKWYATTLDLSDPDSRIRIFLPLKNGPRGIAALLFEDPGTKKIVPPSFNKFYHNLEDGYHFPPAFNSLIVLYDDGSYLKMDSIFFKKNINIAADLSNARLQPADEVSYLWLEENITRPLNYVEKSGSAYRTNKEIRYYKSSAGNVHGTVFDESNEPLAGVNIQIKGTNLGTVTDLDGSFSLQINDFEATLILSFIGYAEQEIQVTWGSYVNVSLVPEVTSLSEVVVIAYGTQRMDMVTGALAGLSNYQTGQLPRDIDEESEEEQEEYITRDTDNQMYQELLNLNKIRSNFSDVGFWEPRLFTDNKGKSTFTVTFPDDITRWDAVVYAMNKYLQTGTGRKSIKSYKPIMAELNVPQFLTRGDSSLFLGKVTNYTSDSTIHGKISWNGSKSLPEKEIRFAQYQTDLLPITASTTDSITTRFAFTRDDGYLDGEERSVEVVEQGVERAEGDWSLLKNGDTKDIRAGDDKDVTVKVLDSQIDIYSGEVEQLLHYRYDCNEQLASKLIGWINQKMLMKYQGKPFRYDMKVNGIIRRLLKNQNTEFLWSWWDISGFSSYWMSAHVLKALKYAKDAGYDVGLDTENIIRKALYKFDILKNYSISDVELLNALAVWGAEINYSRYIPVLDSIIAAKECADQKEARKYFTNNSVGYSYLKEKMLLQEVRQLRNIQYQRDTLIKYEKKGILGEVFFSDNKPDRYWYADKLAANTIAYRIILKDSVLSNLEIPMQMYFFHSHTNNGWNTYQSSEILLSILSGILKESATKDQIASVVVKGKQNTTVKDFPYTVELKPREEIHLQKETGIPLYFMQYVKERVTKEKTGREGFRIKTYFSSHSMELEAGYPVDLVTEVELKGDIPVEHVMIEIPVPGACSYSDKRQGENPVESHREYFKEKAVIFCEKMRPGNYVFKIHLLPRFTGNYYVNPAQVSLMYIPVVNANTDMKKVTVKE